MGIPTFFRKIINQYPQTHFWNPDEKFDYLFIDFNCLIYQVNHALPPDIKPNQYEKELIKGVVKYVETIVCQVVKPSRLAYLAFDGPPPRAKMVDQRRRRYKSVKLDQYRDQLNLEKEEKWDTINITPGTPFMRKLSQELWKAIQKKTFNKHHAQMKVILSDASVPGEGEHKFMTYIRESVKNKNSHICIYGLDADLIVLSLTTSAPNILILREAQDSPIEVEQYGKIGYLYLSPYKYIEALFETLSLTLTPETLHDYIFLTFLTGNDFIRRVLFLKIREKGGGGLDILLSIYKRLRKEIGDHLVKDTRINYYFLTKLMEELAKVEEQQLRDIQRARKHQLTADQEKILQKQGQVPPVTLAMEKFEHSFYFNPMNPYYQKYGHKFKEVDFFQPTEVWRQQYYRALFHVSIQETKYIQMIAEEYIRALNFTWQYYLTGIPPDWHWYYPFEAAPLAMDLAAYLGGKPNANLVKLGKNAFNKKNGPVDIFNQLMLIIPPQKANQMLPAKYVELMTDADSPLLMYYPTDFQLEVLQGGKFIYSDPLLPLIDNDRVKKIIRKIKLSKDEKERNQISNKPKTFPNKDKNKDKNKDNKNKKNKRK